jgi:hypothetical protein
MERTIIKWIYPRKLLKKDTEKTYEKAVEEDYLEMEGLEMG